MKATIRNFAFLLFVTLGVGCLAILLSACGSGKDCGAKGSFKAFFADGCCSGTSHISHDEGTAGVEVCD